MASGLRELKKQRTRAAIQEAALRLIESNGYDATTCEQIAVASSVSSATFFRYFATKEDVILTDDYDPMILAAVSARPSREGPLLAVRRGLADAFAQIDDEAMVLVRSRTALLLSIPALRARLSEQSASARGAFAQALAPRMARPPGDLAVQALAAACAAALGTAVEHWAAGDRELSEVVDEALRALAGR